MEQPTLVDLFCGAGGLSCGFVRAGFRPLAAYDNWDPAVNTYRANLGDHVHKEQLTAETPVPRATVIAGGPPCQGFSSAGARRDDDPRNSLVGAFAEIVAKVKPQAFVFENVEGFLTKSEGDFVLALLEPVIAAGYRVHLRKINAANYGVPQHRKRVLAIGGLGFSPTFPRPTHTAHGAPGALLAAKRLPLTPSLGAAIAGLPPASATQSDDELDHYYQPLQGLDLDRASQLRPGQMMRDLPPELWHDSYARRAFRRVMDGTPSARRGGPPAGIRRLRDDEPCKAITTGATSEFLHPVEDRTLTLRECARVQTFPDGFCFKGTCAERLLLIANAVPPRLAHSIGLCLAKDLRDARPTDEGALLSFIPTLSAGMSPSLVTVVAKVHAAFQPVSSTRSGQLLWNH